MSTSISSLKRPNLRQQEGQRGVESWAYMDNSHHCIQNRLIIRLLFTVSIRFSIASFLLLACIVILVVVVLFLCSLLVQMRGKCARCIKCDLLKYSILRIGPVIFGMLDITCKFLFNLSQLWCIISVGT